MLPVSTWEGLAFPWDVPRAPRADGRHMPMDVPQEDTEPKTNDNVSLRPREETGPWGSGIGDEEERSTMDGPVGPESRQEGHESTEE